MIDPYVSIIVCTYNRTRYLESCLQSIFNQTYKNIEVILVIKDLDENGKKILEKFEHLTTIIQDNKSIGISAARNIGVKNSHGEIIAFIDDDAVAYPNWMKNLIKKYENSNVGGVGGLIIDASSNKPWLFDWYINKFGITKDGDKIKNKKDWFRTFVGCNMSFRKKIFYEIKGFDEDIIFYHEEPDLCIRILKKGYKLELEPTAKVTHYLGDGPTRSTGLYYKCKSRLYFSFKNFGDDIPKRRIILEDLKLLPSEIFYVFRSLSLRNLKAIILARFHEYKRWNII